MEATLVKANVPATKGTWQMTGTQLARVFAEHFGWTVRGNWISDASGRPVACGWDHLAQRLTQRGWVKVGVGINWRAAGEAPRLARVSRESGLR